MIRLKELYKKNKEVSILTIITLLIITIAIIFYYAESSQNNAAIEEVQRIESYKIHDNINVADYAKSKKTKELLVENQKIILWYKFFFEVVGYVYFGLFLIILLFKWKK